MRNLVMVPLGSGRGIRPVWSFLSRAALTRWHPPETSHRRVVEYAYLGVQRRLSPKTFRAKPNTFASIIPLGLVTLQLAQLTHPTQSASIDLVRTGLSLEN
jgi:hypothetical protein